MAEYLVYVSRLVRLPLLDADGSEIGRMSDVVLSATSGHEAPHVNGFVVTVQRRRVFTSAGRITELAVDGARLRRGALNLKQFEPRPGELMVVGDLFGREIRGQRVVDLSIKRAGGGSPGWDVATVALGTSGLIGRGRVREIVEWADVSELFIDRRPMGREAAAISQLHPAEMADVIRKLPLERRRLLAAALEDERLADLMEEMSEDDQVRIMEGLDLGRAARVLDEMEADDAADLLGELPVPQRAQLLGAMDPEEADPVRRLLSYGADTAGGLMTPEPVILPPTATVAEALARVREPELPPALAAQVFVARRPIETPTGRFLGTVGFQRLLRESPSKPILRCLDEGFDPIPVSTPEREVAARIAAYDVVAIPVTDDTGHLVGAVTVDDVLDRVLPPNWRNR